jgi:hypothetical protein
MVSGEAIEFEKACVMVGVGLDWSAVMALPGTGTEAKQHLTELNAKYTWPIVQKIARVARLKAACYVSDTFSTRLSTRIGFNRDDVPRVDFARLLARLYPHRTRPRTVLNKGLGVVWGRDG